VARRGADIHQVIELRRPAALRSSAAPALQKEHSMLARVHKSMKEKDEGFTLIELLVVMIIIGILAAIAIPVFLNQRKKAVDTGVKSDVTNAGKNIASYYVDGTGGISASITGGTLTIVSTDTTPVTISAQKLSNSSTTLPVSPAVQFGVQTGTGCTNATGWYIGLVNSAAGGGTPYYYSAQGGLTTVAPVAAGACTAS
jgi:type IV pilus assembly protein PilA